MQRITSNLSPWSIANLKEFANSLNVFVKEGKTFQVFQAFFFRILLKDETVSHPVKALKNGEASVFSLKCIDDVYLLRNLSEVPVI